jgi:hypothetical protein
MGRSAGMSPGGSYVPHRQLQQQLAGIVSGSMGSMNASDLQHLHASIADSFPSSHDLSASYHSQVGPTYHVDIKLTIQVMIVERLSVVFIAPWAKFGLTILGPITIDNCIWHEQQEFWGMEIWQVQFFLSIVHPFFFCVFSGFLPLFFSMFSLLWCCH